MAEPETQSSGGDAPDERPLQQPADAVQMEDFTKGEKAKSQTASGDGPSLPPKETAPVVEASSSQPSAAGPSAPPVKGKDREAVAKAVVAAKRDDDDMSIGPTDPLPEEASAENPLCNITLLLPSGARHPYKIDEKYLTKRNVDVPDLTEAGKKDPFSISVYTLKELILREWRDEWENKPASPSSIRLIHFGKLLDDKEQVKKYQFSAESPNVVHMSVRPAEMMEEEEAAKAKTAGRESRSDNATRCCVIL